MQRLVRLVSAFVVAVAFSSLSWAETVTVKAATLGVNFCLAKHNMAADSSERYGFYDGERGGLLEEKAWVNVNDASGTINLTDTANNATYRLQWQAGGDVWSPGDAAGKLLASYLDNGSTLTLSGLPFSGYDVAILFSGDGDQFSAVTVNGTDKTYNAAGQLENGSSAWGDRTTLSADTKTLSATGTATAGNVMYLADLTAPELTLQTYNNNADHSGRGTIAAIQIYPKPGTYERQSFDLIDRGATVIALSELGIASETQEVEVVLADGATLKVDGETKPTRLRLRSEGIVGIAGEEGKGTLEEVLSGIAEFDYAETAGLDIGALHAESLTIRNGKTLAMAAVNQVETLTREAGSTLKLTGDITGDRDALPLQDNTTLETTGNVSLGEITINETLKGRSWTLSGGESHVGQLFLRSGEAWTNPGAAGTFALRNGAKLTVEGARLGISNSAGENAAMLCVTSGTQTTLIEGKGTHFSAPNGAVSLSRDGKAVVTVREGATFSAYRLGCVAQGGGAGSTMTVENATLALGKEGATDGLLKFANGTLALKDGTVLTANGDWGVDAATAASALTATGTVTVRPEGNTITLRKFSGEGAFAVEGPGSVVFAEGMASTGGLSVEGNATVYLGTWRPTLNQLSQEAELKLTVTEEERIAGKLSLPKRDGVSLASDRVTLVDLQGNQVEMGAIKVGEDGTLEVELTTPTPSFATTASWSVAEAWSTGKVPTEGTVALVGGETAETTIMVTLDVAIPEEVTRIQIKGHVRLVMSEAQPVIPAGIELLEGATLTVSSDFATAFTVPADTTLVLDGATVSQGVTVNGTLDSVGDTTLSSEENQFAGVLNVRAGTLRLNAGSQNLYGTLNVLAGATYVNLRSSDALRYTGAATVNVWGTVDMGDTRWTIGANNVLNLYAGARVTGAGQGDNQGISAWDWYQANSVNFPEDGNREGNVSIPATLRLRNADQTVTFNVANSNLTVELSGRMIGQGNLKKSGSGNSHLLLSGEGKGYAGSTTIANGYLDLAGGVTLATASITAEDGTALTFLADEGLTDSAYNAPIILTGAGRLDKSGGHAVTLGGIISGNGALNVKEGTLTLTAANTRGSADTTIEEDGTLVLSGDGRLYGTDYATGTVTIRGHLFTTDWVYGKAFGALGHNTGYTVIDGGTVTFIENCGNASETATRGFTITANGATLETEEGVTYHKTNNDAAPITNNGTLRLRGAGVFNFAQSFGGAVTVTEGATLSGTGTLSGTVTFEEGAVLDASAEVLTVGGLALPASKDSVTVKVASGAAKGSEVLKLTTAVPQLATDALKVEGATLGVAPNAEGTALILTFAAEFPETVGKDGGELTEGAAKALLLAAERLNVPKVFSLTGRSGNRDLTAAELSGALECFQGDNLVSAGAESAEGTPLVVAYEFGIADAVYDRESGNLTVTAQVQGGTFAPDVAVELYFMDDGTVASTVTPKANVDTATFTLSEENFSRDGASRPFKVRAVRR